MNTISLNTASVREFLKRTQFIQRNDLMPILANLKLEHSGLRWQLVKNNLEAVCLGPVAAAGEPATILLNERIFTHLVNNAQVEALQLTLQEGKVVIFDGQQTTDLPLEDPAHFPLNPIIPEGAEVFQITEQHLRAIRIAKDFVSQGETSGNFQYVHVKGRHVFGFHNSYFYVNAAFVDLPAMILLPEECNILCATAGVGFVDRDRHHIFFNAGYTYIFTKGEGKTPDLNDTEMKLRLEGKRVSLQRAGLAEFCSTANVISEAALVDCLLEPAEGGVRLSLKDANYSRGTERNLPSVGAPDKFGFNSRLTGPMLKSIPYDTLDAKTNQNCFIVEGKNGSGEASAEVNEWFCFMGLQK